MAGEYRPSSVDAISAPASGLTSSLVHVALKGRNQPGPDGLRKDLKGRSFDPWQPTLLGIAHIRR